MRRSQAYFPEVRIGKGSESSLCSQYTPPASNVFYICTLSTLCSVHSTCYWPQPADLIMQPLRTLGKALAYKSTNTHPSCWYRFQDLVDTFSERQYCLNFQGSRPTSTQGPRLQITALILSHRLAVACFGMPCMHCICKTKNIVIWKTMAKKKIFRRWPRINWAWGEVRPRLEIV